MPLQTFPLKRLAEMQNYFYKKNLKKIDENFQGVKTFRGVLKFTSSKLVLN
jgi:hypothetical protein